MTRRALLFLSLAAGLRADAADQVWDVLASLAGALSAGDASLFLSWLDPAMPGYERLRLNVIALARDDEVQASIDLVDNRGDDRARTVISDWLLLLKQKNGVSPAIRRRQRVTCKMEKRRGKWRVVSLEPQSLLDAPRF